ncbi:iron complex transport system substrate-binding protein [Actimicrobium sp. GrIS 1.19]|uniref:cobalamin-binding protein n=1 Tax=Actimicrobium sp. GrIS 1.19 TaxID=3071708 RepID=UPI002DFCD93F|nr:iron complex transport system substrate-binding protein [Actimicrobium sp. GrIS 1.19]
MLRHLAVLGCWFVSCAAGAAPVTVLDDASRPVTLAAPAKRIISLAPHATELLFAAGAGPKIVGVSAYSNFPAAAANIASVGGAGAVDIERIVTLKPDLVVAWGSGNSALQLGRLRALHIPVFESEPGSYEAIASSLERLGQLAGTAAIGDAAAAAFRQRLQALTASYTHRPTVRVFYQIWGAPLMTLNRSHIISSAVRLCGGENIFARLPQIAPVVSAEAVLQENPEVIVTGGGDNDAAALNAWRRFPGLLAVQRNNLFVINGDWLARAGPRILDGTEQLCRDLDGAREKRPPTTPS